MNRSLFISDYLATCWISSKLGQIALITILVNLPVLRWTIYCQMKPLEFFSQFYQVDLFSAGSKGHLVLLTSVNYSQHLSLRSINLFSFLLICFDYSQAVLSTMSRYCSTCSLQQFIRAIDILNRGLPTLTRVASFRPYILFQQCESLAVHVPTKMHLLLFNFKDKPLRLLKVYVTYFSWYFLSFILFLARLLSQYCLSSRENGN